MKRVEDGVDDEVLASPPAWGRGLKRAGKAKINTLFKVAPRVGAWIETFRIAGFVPGTSPPAWGRGLKHQ